MSISPYLFYSIGIDVDSMEHVPHGHSDGHGQCPHGRQHHLVANLIQQLFNLCLYFLHLTTSFTSNLHRRGRRGGVREREREKGGGGGAGEGGMGVAE